MNSGIVSSGNGLSLLRCQAIAKANTGLSLIIPSETYLTHWGRDEMDAISQTTFSNVFSWMKSFEFRLKFHWSLFLRVQLTIFQHWFRWWLGADQATSHCLNQWWFNYWRTYASFGLDELIIPSETDLSEIRKWNFSYAFPINLWLGITAWNLSISNCKSVNNLLHRLTNAVND